MKSEEISMLVLSKKRFEEGWSGQDGRNNNESEPNGIFCQDELVFLDTTSTYRSKGHLPLEPDIGLSRGAMAG